jgi:hypothetical protein
MAARIIVETPEQHSAWIRRASNPALAGAALPAVLPAADAEGSKVAEVSP